MKILLNLLGVVAIIIVIYELTWFSRGSSLGLVIAILSGIVAVLCFNAGKP